MLALAACSTAPATPTQTPIQPTTAPAATVAPIEAPTQSPTFEPTSKPTETEAPTETPEAEPTNEPTTTTQPITEKASDPCGILKDDDVIAIFGKLDMAPSAQPNQQFGGEDCMYSAESGMLIVGLNKGGKDKATIMLDTLKKGGAPLQPLPGVGDEAYVAVGKVDPSQPNMAGLLLFSKGDQVVNLTAISSFEKDKLLNAMKTLGEIAAGDLK